jgi:VanZ family protein
MAQHQRGQLVGTRDAQLDAAEYDTFVEATAREFDLRQQRNRRSPRAEVQLPSLGRVGRVVHGDVLDPNPSRLEDLVERPRPEHLAHPVAEDQCIEVADVEVHILRVPNALEEEPEIAAPSLTPVDHSLTDRRDSDENRPMPAPGPRFRGVVSAAGSPTSSGAANFGRYWLPVLVWATVIFIGSGDALSSSNTSRFLTPLIQSIFPRLPHESVDALMFATRKLGHVAEYGILSTLCWRAVHRPLSGGIRGWSWRHAGIALAMSALYAATDEFHQMFVASRSGSPWDVLTDTCGAAAGVLTVWGITRLAGLRRSSSRS